MRKNTIDIKKSFEMFSCEGLVALFTVCLMMNTSCLTEFFGKKLHAEKDQKRRIFVEILRPREGGLEQFGIYPRILADRSVSL